MQLCLFESRLEVSRVHAANYRDGPMYNGSVGMVCPTHILDEKGGSSEPSRTPPMRTPLCMHGSLEYMLY